MRSVVIFFLIFSCAIADEKDFLPALEAKLEEKFTEYAGYVSNWLQSFNDEHLGKTVMGRFLHYDEMKTKLTEAENPSKGRGVKKMGMAMMPLIFHIGATSTWMLLTTVLTAKSLAVGLMLLVFKIAVSSAKLAAFFTHLKHSKHGHHDWTPSWVPQYEHHDNHIEHHPDHHGTISHHIPEWTPNDIPHYFREYKHIDHGITNEIHDFKNNEFHDFKNNEFHNFNTHDINDYKTIPTRGIHGFNDVHGDFNHFEGAKKKIDSEVG